MNAERRSPANFAGEPVSANHIVWRIGIFAIRMNHRGLAMRWPDMPVCMLRTQVSAPACHASNIRATTNVPKQPSDEMRNYVGHGLSPDDVQ